MKTAPRPNPLRKLIATSPNPKHPIPVPDPQALAEEPPTLSRTIEAEVAQLARYYRQSSARYRAMIMADAERYAALSRK